MVNVQLKTTSTKQLKSYCLKTGEIKTMKFIKWPTARFQIRKTFQLLLRVNLFRRSNLIIFIENATKVSTTKSRLPQFGDLLQCESSRNLHQTCVRTEPNQSFRRQSLYFSTFLTYILPPCSHCSFASFLAQIYPPFSSPGSLFFTALFGIIWCPFYSSDSLYFTALFSSVSPLFSSPGPQLRSSLSRSSSLLLCLLTLALCHSLARSA